MLQEDRECIGKRETLDLHDIAGFHGRSASSAICLNGKCAGLIGNDQKVLAEILACYLAPQLQAVAGRDRRSFHKKITDRRH